LNRVNGVLMTHGLGFARMLMLGVLLVIIMIIGLVLQVLLIKLQMSLNMLVQVDGIIWIF